MSNVSIKTDFHTHLLPDVDCSGNPDISVKLIAEMKAAGIQNIVITPHFYPQYNSNVDDFLGKRDRHIAKLQSKMEEAGLTGIALFPAAEVLLCPGLEGLEGLERLCISGTNTILIEMPDLPWSDALLDTLQKIKSKLNLEVVIAHVDRYGKQNAIQLIKFGYKAQINADSTVSFAMKRTVLGWVKSGYIYALGSDKHVHSDKRSEVYKEFPKASAALEKYAEIINERSLKLIGK